MPLQSGIKDDGQKLIEQEMIETGTTGRGSAKVVVPSVGTHANAWNAAAVLANGVSASLAVTSQRVVSGFGNASAATTITLQVSQNGTTFYDTPVTQTLSAAGDFHVTTNTGAAHARLKSSAAATITATIAGK